MFHAVLVFIFMPIELDIRPVWLVSILLLEAVSNVGLSSAPLAADTSGYK